jgi:hypothetical protein
MGAMSDEQSRPESGRPKLQFIRAVFADAALALVATVVIGLVIASLAAAGIITMNLAYVLLILAWIAAVGGSFLAPWPFPHKHRAIFAFLSALILAAIGWYEATHYEKPLSAKEIAEEVVKVVVRPISPPSQPRKVLFAQCASAQPIVSSADGKIYLININAISPPLHEHWGYHSTPWGVY